MLLFSYRNKNIHIRYNLYSEGPQDLQCTITLILAASLTLFQICWKSLEHIGTILLSYEYCMKQYTI